MNATIEKVGFVAEPDGRGTIGLLWSCFATLVLCTWSAVHPNLPAVGDSQWRVFGRKLKYMVVATVAPEFVVACAFEDMLIMRNFKKKFNIRHPLTQEPWTLQQYFFLCMGGYVIQTDRQDETKQIRISSHELLQLLRNETVETPIISNSDIDDRSKANWFTKTIALLQITSFLAQLLGRAIQRLPVTTLELFTLGIVLCAVGTYIFWWEKPFDIQKPVLIHATSHSEWFAWPRSVGRIGITDNSEDDTWATPFVMVVSSLIFGAVHLIAWSFAFPTEVERLLWRVGSVCCTILPLFITLINYWGWLTSDTSKAALKRVFFVVVTSSYIIVRLYLFAEMLSGLRAVPRGVYKTPNWAQYFPSFG